MGAQVEPTVRVRILGPVELVVGGSVVSLPPRVVDLLAILAARPNAVVHVDELVDGLWPAGPPRTSGKSVQVRVHELRSALGDAGRVRSHRRGYLFALHTEELDASQFEDLLGRGRAMVAAGEVSSGAELIRRALGLWRGSAFAGLDRLVLVRQTAERLNDVRWQAVEELADADLALGRNSEVAADLGRLAVEHPFRERLHGQLMIALYRAGRPAESLSVYRAVRRRLVDELGVEPGRYLQDLHQAMLVHDLTLEGPGVAGQAAPLVVPAELPVDVPAFTGRRREIARLRSGLAVAGKRMAIVAISGAGGVGKSALAVHVAHAVAADFPDGQLFVQLHGAMAGVAAPAPVDVLGRLLRTLGVANPPHGEDEAAARFRSLTAGRRLLIVLDDAADAAQVRPLLPGGNACAVLVTSRRVLSTLDGAAHLRLGTLTEAEAIALLGHLAGADRIAGEGAAAAQIARFCGFLPLALRISGARLVTQPQRTLSGFADQLSVAHDRLDQLRHADLAVRTSIAVSHRDLEAQPGGAHAFTVLKLLALMDAPDFTVVAAAALADEPVDRTQSALDQLAETQLLEAAPFGRYRVHDLIRLYAREHVMAETAEPARNAALRRVFAHYESVGRHCTELLDPGQLRWLPDAAAADPPAGAPRVAAEVPDWLDAELGNLLAAVRQAAALPGELAVAAISLAASLNALLDLRGYWHEWVIVNETVARVGERLGDRTAQARALMFLGYALAQMGHVEDGLRHVERALHLWRGLGDRLGESGALNARGSALAHSHRHAEAIETFEQSLRLRQEMGDRHGEAMLLDNIGCAYLGQGRADEAIGFHQRSLAVSRAVGNRRTETHALGHLADALSATGRSELAIPYYEHSLRMQRELGDRHYEAWVLWGLGNALHALNRCEQARGRWSEALAILVEIGRLTVEQATTALSDSYPTLPRPLELIK
jgi:DNA-binding SARP family transcriptional activator